MKVKELIELLLEYPMDQEIVIGHLDRGIHTLETEQIISCDQYLDGPVIIVGE